MQMARSPALVLFLPSMMLALVLMAEPRLPDLDLSPLESDMQPNVVLEEHGNRTVEEYRVNNKLYMIKITPTIGAPYYLIDDDGSGDMEFRRTSGGRDTRVPQWVLFSW